METIVPVPILSHCLERSILFPEEDILMDKLKDMNVVYSHGKLFGKADFVNNPLTKVPRADSTS